MTTKDAIIKKCFIISSFITARGNATLRQDEQAYNKWNKQLDKTILELVRLIKNDTA